MTLGMEQFVKSRLFDPTVGKLMPATNGVLTVMALDSNEAQRAAHAETESG